LLLNQRGKEKVINFQISSIVAGGFPATLVTFTIDGDGTISPADLSTLDIPSVDGTKGVIISGRGPVWLFCTLAHHWHITRWAATFDPRQGAVVFSQHHPDAPKPGTVLSLT
jgi:CRISPR-associated protein Csx3